ncbi:putative isomerase YddE [bacterium BMS3Abin04]|nr:putative isomerase YddE [bacterium BMS3Abin04]
MALKIYQVDAFTNKLFKGNPAAVCPLNEWLDDKTMQNIAAENNLSETAFFVKEEKHYIIRWFTPTLEIPLCGHATLASAFIIFNYLETGLTEIKFNSKSGILTVTRNSDLITLNFPSLIVEKVDIPKEIINSVKIEPTEVYFNKSYLALYKDEVTIRNIKPDFTLLKEIHTHGLIVTAPGDNVDFVSRFFVPDAGINEDPVTGYAHTILTPFWAKKLGKTKLNALQLSKRGGELFLEDKGERVNISGRAKLYMIGEIFI